MAGARLRLRGRRLRAGLAPYQRFYEAYDGVGPGGIVVQDVQQSDVGPDRQRLELWFGDNFGGVAVVFGRLDGVHQGSTAAGRAAPVGLPRLPHQ
ncbi:hypothetical protein GCM10027614_75920 [Micromonospora vulcania]